MRDPLHCAGCELVSARDPLWSPEERDRKQEEKKRRRFE
jgi:hypothetical protein